MNWFGYFLLLIIAASQVYALKRQIESEGRLDAWSEHYLAKPSHPESEGDKHVSSVHMMYPGEVKSGVVEKKSSTRGGGKRKLSNNYPLEAEPSLAMLGETGDEKAEGTTAA